MDENRIKEVFSDEEFVKGLLALEEPAEVQAALKEKGIISRAGSNKTGTWVILKKEAHQHD